MTAEEFRTRWTGHVPKVQDVTGEYAVLVPLVERPEGLCLLYEVRADTLGRQPGEVCFPGGRLEPGEDAVSCALRETWEELGIPRPAVEVVAELDWLPQVHLVMNRIQPKLLRQLRTTIDDAMDAAGLPLLGIVPEDPQVMLCANQGQPLILRASRGAAVAYLNIAKRLLGQKAPLMKMR